MQRITGGFGRLGRFIGRTTRGTRQSIGYGARWVGGSINPFRRLNERDRLVQSAIAQAKQIVGRRNYVPGRWVFEQLGKTSWYVGAKKSRSSGNIGVTITHATGQTTAVFSMTPAGQVRRYSSEDTSNYFRSALNRTMMR